MHIYVASLGSGSRGNATLVRAANTTVLVDCGYSLKLTLNRLQALSVAPQHINAILVTHEHADHLQGVHRLANRYDIPVYLTYGTCQHRHAELIKHKILVPLNGRGFPVGELWVNAVPVPHDASEACQYIFEFAGKRLGILTDLGHVSKRVREAYNSLDGVLLEFNHDYSLLMNGAYPPALKRRVAGNFGHLNNAQSVALLNDMDLDRLKLLVASHISEQNNCSDLVRSAIENSAVGRHTKVVLAKQDKILDWIQV